MEEKQHTFRETLEQLKILQGIFNERFSLEKKLTELPKEINLQEQMVFRMKENFLVVDKKYQELKKSIDQKREELDHLQENREKYEKEITQVNSQRDYEQIDRAIKENLDQEIVMRNALQALEAKFKDVEEEFSNTEELLKNQEMTLEEMNNSIESQLKDFNSELKSIKGKESHIADNLNYQLVFKFERIIKSKSGEGIVAVKKNVCSGCHMVLPLQFVNEVRKEDEVLNCPYCSKMLYFEEEEKEGESGHEEIQGLQDLFEEEDVILDDFDEEDYELFVDRDNIGSDSYAIPTEEEASEEEGDEDDLEDSDEEEGFGEEEREGFGEE